MRRALIAAIGIVSVCPSLAVGPEELERMEADILARYKGSAATAIVQILGAPHENDEREGVEFLTWQTTKQRGIDVGGGGMQKTRLCRATFEFKEQRLSALSLVGGGREDRSLCKKLVEPLTRGADSAKLSASASEATEPAPPGQLSETLTNGDVVKLAQAKLSDAVIITKIKASACDFDVSTPSLTALKEAGVGDAVIQVMIEMSKSE